MKVVTWNVNSIRSRLERLVRWLAKVRPDVFRKHHPEGGLFSWWDYRAAAFRRNNGLRIDLMLCSELLAKRCRNSWIDKGPRQLERPSDHAPVVSEFN